MKKKLFLSSILSIIMCLSLITGATFALFTSESSVNIAVTSGNVSVTAVTENLQYKTLGVDNWIEEAGNQTVFGDTNVLYGHSAKIDGGSVILDKMLPGDAVKFDVRIHNASDVVVKYRTSIVNDESADTGLFSDLKIKVREENFSGKIYDKWETILVGSNDVIIPIEIELPEGVGGEGGETCAINISVQAIQGNAKTVDEVFVRENAVVDTATATTTEETTVGAVDGTKAEVPAGTKLQDGKTTLSLNVTKADEANVGNFQIGGEDALALNIDIPEVADDNTGVIIITLKGYFPDKPASIALFHEGVLMTPVASASEVDSADEYYYDKNTGDIVLATDNFSNFTAVENVKAVSTAQELYDVVFNQGNKYKNIHNVILANDIDCEIQINVKNNVVIDLNGKTLTSTATSASVTELFNVRAPLTVKNGEIVAGVKPIVNAYADVAFENVKMTADAYGTSILKTQGGCYSLILNNVEISLKQFKVNGGALISISGGTIVEMNEVSVDMILDTTYTSYFINRSADNVTMTNCEFNIVDKENNAYNVVRKEDSAVKDKFAFEKK